MPIIQINVFVCECCGETDVTSNETCLLDDPVVVRTGWGYDYNTLLCPTCLDKEKEKRDRG